MDEKLLVFGREPLAVRRERKSFAFEVEFADKAKRVSKSGVRHFRGRSFRLEKWNPSIGCLEGDGGVRALCGSEFWASLCIFGEEASSRGLETLVGDSWLWMKTQPSAGILSGLESS